MAKVSNSDLAHDEHGRVYVDVRQRAFSDDPDVGVGRVFPAEWTDTLHAVVTRCSVEDVAMARRTLPDVSTAFQRVRDAFPPWFGDMVDIAETVIELHEEGIRAYRAHLLSKPCVPSQLQATLAFARLQLCLQTERPVAISARTHWFSRSFACGFATKVDVQ